jgi:hypothetical protein
MLIVSDKESNSSVPADVNMKQKCIAHHEAGHMAIAAANGLRLRSDGFCIDPLGDDGLACYFTQPDGSALCRERIIVSTFAGFYAEKCFREESAYHTDEHAPDFYFAFSIDGNDARKLFAEMQLESLSQTRESATWADLQRQSEQLVRQYWLAIKALATALLAKDWEPLKPLKSGDSWSNETTAKYVTGEEAVEILSQCEITATCAPNC